jgi:galactofuranosylgalactofuranosylrhamnosyl-N-acetylglucosaminyl-diphospho-decaprenol beta-1,5/1,6-galactofuranosyltransferase
MVERIIQRIVMPPRHRLTRLYCRFNHPSAGACIGPRMRGRRTLILPRGRVMRTDTWFNAFFERYWREYTQIQQLALRVRVSGAGVLRLYRRTSEHKQRLLQEIHFSGRNRELHVEVSDSSVPADGIGLLFLEIEAHSSPLQLHEAEWLAGEVVTHPVRLVAAFCSFNRAPLLLRNITTLFSDPAAAEVLESVIVVDQGFEKVHDHPGYAALMHTAAGRIHLVEQANYGGAGGFTRCLLEARKATSANHIVLMDDDALLEPESILRAAAFLSLARSDLAVGGHMLDPRRPHELTETGSRYRPEHLRIDEPSRRRVDRADDLTPFLEPQARHYNGWWFFAFPLAVLDRAGLPMPLFLRGDDLEFGCRLLRSGVPTVSLPGVAVWHEPFERKGRGWHAFYELRNQLIVGALHFPTVRAATVARRFFSRLLDELLAYDYYESWLLCEAATVYLRGPESLRHPPRYVHHSLQAKQAKLAPRMQPRDNTPQAALRRPPSITSGIARLWRLWLVLRNLMRPSPAPETPMQYVLRGPGEQWYDIAGADVIGVEELHRDKLVMLRRSRGRFVRLLLRGAWIALGLLVSHHRVVRRWRTGAPELTSREFWTAYLHLSSAVIGENACGFGDRGNHAENQGSLLQLGRF